MLWVWILGSIAALLLLAWAYSVFHRRRAARRRPPFGSFIEVEGVNVHHVLRGQGPPVVFLHGLNGFMQDFTDTSILPELEADFTVLALDRPGYGHSTRPTPGLTDIRAQADWVVSLLDEMGFERAILVGHSLGGGLATTVALRHPDRVAGLVLIAPYVHPYTEPEDWIHSLPNLPGLRTGIGHVLAAPVARLLGPSIVGASFEPQPTPEGYHELWLDLSLRPDHFDTTVEEVRRIDLALATLRERYPEIDAPTRILTGSEDRSVEPELNAMRLADELADAELVLLDGYGHMVPRTHPELVVEAVRTVAKRAEKRGRGARLA